MSMCSNKYESKIYKKKTVSNFQRHAHITHKQILFSVEWIHVQNTHMSVAVDRKLEKQVELLMRNG